MNAVTKDTQFTKWTAGVASDLHTETLTTFTQAVHHQQRLQDAADVAVVVHQRQPGELLRRRRQPVVRHGHQRQQRVEPALRDPDPGKRAGRSRAHVAPLPDQARSPDPPADHVRGGAGPAGGDRRHADPPAAGDADERDHARRVHAARRRERSSATAATSAWIGWASGSTSTTRPARSSRWRTATSVDSSGKFVPFPNNAERHVRDVQRNQRHGDAAVDVRTGDAVLRAAGDALRAAAGGDHGGCLLGAADLPGLQVRTVTTCRS